jgi:hypothetical protein
VVVAVVAVVAAVEIWAQQAVQALSSFDTQTHFQIFQQSVAA